MAVVPSVLDNLVLCVCLGMSTSLALAAAGGLFGGGQKWLQAWRGLPRKGRRRRKEELVRVVSFNVNDLNEEE